MLESAEQKPECSCRHSRYLPIAEGFNAVHSSGHPMSHSTHVGFS